MILGGLLLLLSSIGHTQDFLTSAEKIFFDESQIKRRFGVEIEFTGLKDYQIEKIIEAVFHAQVIERLEHGEVKFESPYGEIKLKIESSAWRIALTDPKQYQKQWEIDLRSAPREIVLPPLTYENIELFERLGAVLQEFGAIGTTASNAVSTQVNVEMPTLINNPDALKNLINLLRIYSRPEHVLQMQEKLKIPKIRQEYLYELQPGFLKKLQDPMYQPTLREFYDDYLYRQSLEFLGFRNAWTLPIEKARELLLDQPEVVVPQIVKMVRLRISSLLLEAIPDDPLSFAIRIQKWARPAPIVEFREFNNDFDFIKDIRRALGIVHSAETLGNYDHDTILEKITGIDRRDIKKIRDLKSKKKIIRYAIYDPKEKYLSTENEPDGIVWIQVHPKYTGHRPLVIAGESIVYHRRHIHKSTLLGKYNPGLENALIQQAMENKIFEMKIIQYFLPGVMPESVALVDLIGTKPVTPHSCDQLHKPIDYVTLLEALKARFPEGWVMKGAWDFSTEKSFITDEDLDPVQMQNADLREFEEFKTKIEKDMKGEDPEAIIDALKKHKDYKIWKIKGMLAQPEHIFFQKKIIIIKEFRVEVQGGS
ncbi:MAG: amidoligase family protein, partial [Deltaproteobacteria bacterium]|nr:amidoligase family protein [Deltaproteobacteria bacterium]